MARITPYGPDYFVPFSCATPLEYLIHTGTGTTADPHIALGELTIPGFNSVADRLNINVGALGEFATFNGYEVVYVINNPNDTPANFERHYLGRKYKSGDRLFESSLENNLLALYFNGLTASRVIGGQKDITYSVEMWIKHLSWQLRLGLEKSINSRSWSQIRRLAQTTFIINGDKTDARIVTDDDIMLELGKAIRDMDAEK